MKIKKVDDKPMVIHTKKKAKIHMHEPKKAKIKGSNIYTVQRGPKIASAKINDTGKKKSYRKSTIHQAEKKEKEPSKFKRNIRESNTSIKTKNTNLHIAGRTGALATGAVTEQVEGGQEVSQAAYLAYEATERNMLMTLEDYKKFVAIDDMSELADQMLLLGRTLAEGFTEYYRAANVTVFAKFCRDDVELGRFLQGYYNDSKKFYFDKATSSPECITKMDEIGMTDRGWIDDFILHYEKCDRTFERGQTFHNFNDHDYMVLEALSPRNLVVMDMKSGSLTIALGATEYKRYPKDEEPTKDNTTIGVSWEHGIYLGSTLSQTNFKAYKREYGTPEKIKDVYDYRAKLKQKFYFYQDLSKDDDIPKNMQNDFLHQMYKEFGTIEEEYFYDRLEDGKYDEGFKERQVKEKKSR